MPNRRFSRHATDARLDDSDGLHGAGKHEAATQRSAASRAYMRYSNRAAPDSILRARQRPAGALAPSLARRSLVRGPCGPRESTVSQEHVDHGACGALHCNVAIVLCSRRLLRRHDLKRRYASERIKDSMLSHTLREQTIYAVECSAMHRPAHVRSSDRAL